VEDNNSNFCPCGRLSDSILLVIKVKGGGQIDVFGFPVNETGAEKPKLKIKEITN